MIYDSYDWLSLCVGPEMALPHVGLPLYPKIAMNLCKPLGKSMKSSVNTRTRRRGCGWYDEPCDLELDEWHVM